MTKKYNQARKKDKELPTEKLKALLIMMGWAKLGPSTKYHNVYEHPTSGDWIQIKGAIDRVQYFAKHIERKNQAKHFSKQEFIEFLSNQDD